MSELHIRAKTTAEKALDINLDQLYYGTFAEIGAGQEVARQFFQAGKASQTVALSISAYDMTYSDIIYGKEKSGRYVCLPRLDKMLDREFAKLQERLGPSRADSTCFFSFADTVATGTSKGGNTCHGWMGVKFQAAPGGEPQVVKLHVRMLDRYRLQQQENLGRLGVNLLHSCFYKRKSPTEFLAGLFDHIRAESLTVDAVYFSGSEFKKFDEIIFNLMLVDRGFSQACLVDQTGRVQNPQDYLWNKSVLIQRGVFNPVTNTHLEILQNAGEQFRKEFSIKSHDQLAMFEFLIDNKIKKTQLPIELAAARIRMISQLQIPVLVSKFSLFYQLKQYVRNSTKAPMAIVIGAGQLEKVFDESYYSDLQGGLLEGMAKLLGKYSRLYVYPHFEGAEPQRATNFSPAPHLRHVFSHFLENKFICDLKGCDNLNTMVRSDDVLKLIRKKDKSWKHHVPEKIHKFIESQF